MKSKILITGAAIVALLAGCTKPTPDPVEQAQVPQASSSQFGVSVNDGRLHFATIQDFNNALQLVNNERRSFAAYVQTLEGFTSKQEAKQMNKSEPTCDCPLDDDYATAMVNSHFMMDVGDWTVKLNGCNQRYYALYKRGLTDEQTATGIAALAACDFATTHHFYEISNEYDLAEELSILEEIFAGNPNAAERRCKDVACSDRMDVSWADSYNSWGSVWITLPETRLHYNRAWFGGAVTIYAFDDGSDNFFQNRWFYELYDSQFKERCGDGHTINAESNILYDSHGGWDGSHPGQWWQDRIYDGPRLKAGEGSVKAKSKHRKDKFNPDHNFFWETVDLEILF